MTYEQFLNHPFPWLRCVYLRPDSIGNFAGIRDSPDPRAMARDNLLLAQDTRRVPAQEVASHRPDQTRKVAAWLFHGGLQFEGIVLNELVNASSLEKYRASCPANGCSYRLSVVISET